MMALNGLYARLYAMQFRDPDAELAALAAARAQEEREKPKREEPQPAGLLGQFAWGGGERGSVPICFHVAGVAGVAEVPKIGKK